MIAMDPSAYGLRDNTRQKMMDECYQSSITQWQSYQTQANMDTRMAIGDQRMMGGLDGEFYQNQKFVFNLIHSYRQMILGHQKRTRKSSICVPLEDRYQQVTDDYSGTLFWTMKADNMLYKISDAFDGALVRGLTLTHRWMDYRLDPKDPIIRIKNYAPSSCIMDPWWRERDLSDCNFIWLRDFFNLKQIKQLVPDFEKNIKHIPQSYNSSIRFTFMPESYKVRSRNKNNYAYDQFFYANDREATLIYSPDRAETYEIKGDEDTRRMWVDMNFQPDEKANLEEIKTRVPCIHLAIAVNDRVVYDEYHTDSYPFNVCTAFFEPESINYNYRFYGIPRIARDPQYLFNRRMQIQLDVLESLPNSGINVVEDALIDKNDAFKRGPGQIRTIKKGYVPNQVVQDMMPPQVDASAFKMTDDLSALSRSLIGINEELMGMAEGSDTGIQEMLRQGASLTTLQSLFDNLDLYQKTLSQGLLEDIRHNYSVAKIRRILGRDPDKEFFNLNTLKYDIEIEDGLNTSTQKQMQFAQALQLQQLGLPISPRMLIQASTLQNKNDWIKDMEQQQQQQQQMEQQKLQSEMMVAQANAKLLESQAMANKGMAMEKMSQIEGNRAEAKERRAKAVDDLDQSVLHKAETLIKLQELKLNNVEKTINIMQLLQQGSHQEVENGSETKQNYG